MWFLFAGSYCIMFLLFCQVIVKYNQPDCKCNFPPSLCIWNTYLQSFLFLYALNRFGILLQETFQKSG